MAIEIGARPEGMLAPADLIAWHGIPAAIVGDELNRTGLMHGALRPLTRGLTMVGQAFTVDCMVGDNGPLHYALERLWPGAILVVDGRGHVDTALWGEILHTCAREQGAGGVVIDGAMRDSTAIANSGLAAYARGVCPRGPHKGWGGSMLQPIQCGGVPVSPGDLVIGDDDGVVVVRPDQLPGLLDRCRARIAKEETALARIRRGETTVKIFSMAPPETVAR